MAIEKKDIGIPVSRIILDGYASFELEDSEGTPAIRRLVELDLFDETLIRLPLIVPTHEIARLQLQIEKLIESSG